VLLAWLDGVTPKMAVMHAAVKAELAFKTRVEV